MNLQNFKGYLDEAIHTLGLPGVDCIVYQNHREIFRHAAGYSDLQEKKPMASDALYNIYSATKVVTCVAALQLIEKGILDFSEPVSTYLPAYKDLYITIKDDAVRPAKTVLNIMHLFTMTSGISYQVDSLQMKGFLAAKGGKFTSREFADAIAGQPLAFDPGDDWLYGFSHDVLGAVIEVATGLSLGTYMRENIFVPIGMSDTGFSVAEIKLPRMAPQYNYDLNTGEITKISADCYGKFGDRQESGGSGLISSCKDYILFADALACGGEAKNGNRIISQHSLDLMGKNYLTGKTLTSFHQMIPRAGNGYGLGVSVLINPEASCSLAPAGSFSWGGIGGVQNYFDRENRLSCFVAQHLLNSPKHLFEPKLRNILYTALSDAG